MLGHSFPTRRSSDLSAQIASGKPYRSDYRIVLPDGAIKHIHEEVEIFRDGGERPVRISGTVHSNSGDLNAALAARGAGVAYEPDFIVDDEVRAGRLVRLLPDYTVPLSPIYAVYPTRKHLSAKVRLFVDYLVERFAAPQGR